MFILLLVIGIILAIGCYGLYWKTQRDSTEGICYAVGAIGGCLAVVSILGVCITSIIVSKASVVDDKIAMYQDENTKIEQQIASVVEGYQKYETDIFKSTKSESAITLVSLYPELKSDKLVQSQIEVYTANNKKIKALKEEKIEGDMYRWWLYFGGSK